MTSPFSGIEHESHTTLNSDDTSIDHTEELNDVDSLADIEQAILPIAINLDVYVAPQLRLLPCDLGYRTQSIPSPDDPNAVARKIIRDLRKNENTFMVRWRGMWVVYNNITRGRYKTAPDGDDSALVQDMIRTSLDGATYTSIARNGDLIEKLWLPTTARTREVSHSMETYLRLAGDVPSGTWLTPNLPNGATNDSQTIVCRNGLLQVQQDRPYQLLTHTPDFFSTVFVDVDYDHDSPTPKVFLEWLDGIFVDQPESILTLQEWFGYIISGDTSLQKILLLVSPPRSGKGTLAWILEQLVGGAEQVAHPSLSRLSDSFGLEPVYDKTLAIIGDARISKDTKSLVEILLNISGEDAVTVNRKNRSQLNLRLGTRFMVMSNEPPDLRDDSGAMAHRFIPLTWVGSHLGHEDVELKNKLAAELPGILLWALKGLQRLAKQRRFTVSSTSQKFTDELVNGSSPIRQFITSCCVNDLEAYTLKTHLYTSYVSWCTVNGHHAASSTAFHRQLKTAFPDLDAKKRGPRGQQGLAYLGIKLILFNPQCT